MSIWQTAFWQDMLIKSGQTDEYFVVEQDISLTEETEIERKKIFVEKRRVSLGEYGLFVIGFEGELDENTWESLISLCKEEKCLFLQGETINYFLQPLSLEKGEDSGESGKSVMENRRNFKKFIPPYTCLIDLTQSQEDILKAMKPKGRYNIKLAQKKGVVVEKMPKTPENIQRFYELLSETTSRDYFAGNTLEYYSTFLSALKTSELYFAFHEDDILAAGIFVQNSGVMTYYYGASSNLKRNLMAPYLLQWKAICDAKSQGCQIYDFLGVAGDEEKNSPLAGVTDFKMKLCPQKSHVSQSYLYIHKRWKYALIQFLKHIRR